ncbi:MAG: hypothetical protein JXR69_04180 [Candidatus Delongbacteria bacterium]|nr:hypothetical protein [Candidatus Delongbacteria bacterium]
MKKCFIIVLLIALITINAEYLPGDHIPDMQFTDTNIDSSGTVIYSDQSTKDIISSGKIVVISFFGVG